MADDEAGADGRWPFASVCRTVQPSPSDPYGENTPAGDSYVPANSAGVSASPSRSTGAAGTSNLVRVACGIGAAAWANSVEMCRVPRMASIFFIKISKLENCQLHVLARSGSGLDAGGNA